MLTADLNAHFDFVQKTTTAWYFISQIQPIFKSSQPDTTQISKNIAYEVNHSLQY